jgi:uncharacterized protein YcbX
MPSIVDGPSRLVHRRYDHGVSRELRIHSLHVYPLKSARVVDVDTARVGPRGLLGDREWMFITASGRFVTQRSHPLLARLTAMPADGGVTLTHPHAGTLQLTTPEVLSPTAGESRRVTVWKRDIDAIDAGEIAADFATRVLGEPARIVAAGSDNFPDGYPLLICTLASLEDLNHRLSEALPMNRFRPNLVLEGAAPWEEDRLRVLCIGDVHLRLVKPCTRCVMTGIVQETGRQGLSPLPALQEFRYDENLRGVTFGQNARVAHGIGDWLTVGDRVLAD